MKVDEIVIAAAQVVLEVPADLVKTWGQQNVSTNTFGYISLNFSAFLCISLNFSLCFCICLRFSTFHCISLHFTLYILGQFDGAYRRPMDAICCPLLTVDLLFDGDIV